MKQTVRIGVTLTHGCTITGGETAIDVLSKSIDIDQKIAIDPRLIKEESPLFLTAVADLNARLKASVREIVTQGKTPLVFGGDHALAIGSIAGATQDNDQAVLWIDAHGDCNTDETSISQRIHGMPLAVVQGHGHPVLTALIDSPIPPQNVLLVGIRDLDPEEEANMRTWGNRFITMKTIREKGNSWLCGEILTFMHSHRSVHVSFDCDSMDPSFIRGVNTPVSEGFNQEEILPLLETILNEDNISSMDIVEFNPQRDDGETLGLILSIDRLYNIFREE